MKFRPTLAVLVPLAVLCGCSSLSSTYVGDATPGAKFQGMPIVVQRPKYLKVTVKEVIYGVLADRTATDNNGNTLASVENLGMKTAVIEVSTEVVSVGEVYALDLKRPASGTTEYAVEFDPNGQYPKKVGAKMDDQTIAAVGDVLKKVGEVFKPASTAGAAKPAVADVTRISENILKIELRSLADPSAAPIVLYEQAGRK